MDSLRNRHSIADSADTVIPNQPFCSYKDFAAMYASKSRIHGFYSNLNSNFTDQFSAVFRHKYIGTGSVSVIQKDKGSLCHVRTKYVFEICQFYYMNVFI